MSDLFTALVVLAIATRDDLTVPAIVILILAAFVIVTSVAAIVYSERNRPVMPYSLIDYEDLVLDSLVFDHHIRAETVTEAEWLRVYAHFKAGDLTPTQSAAMIANARKRGPSNDN